MVLFPPPVTEPKKLLLATNNPGKIAELISLLSDLPSVDLVTPALFGLDLEVEEDGADYAQNAALKAKAFAQASGLPSLADDSGLEVEALSGAPGLLSARYAPRANASDADRRTYLLSQLVAKPKPWLAKFRSTVCLAMPDGRTLFAHGECLGEIVPVERGQGGFGYDRIFLIQGLDRTMAELSMAEKNKLSHRARAVAEARVMLQRELALTGQL